MANKFVKFFNFVFKILFPSNIKCVICSREVFENGFLCAKCKENLPRISTYCLRCGTQIDDCDASSYCEICKKESAVFSLARSPFVYENQIVSLVRKFKYDGKKHLADFMAEEMVKCYEKSNFPADLILFVPLFEKREKKRGFNQAELLANGISKLVNIPISKGNLKRTKDTKTQTKLKYGQRKENVQDAFVVSNHSEFEGKRVLIIDDIYTTGATMKSLCLELKKSNVKSIMCLTFAHTDNFIV